MLFNVHGWFDDQSISRSDSSLFFLSLGPEILERKCFWFDYNKDIDGTTTYVKFYNVSTQGSIDIRVYFASPRFESKHCF